MFDEIIYQLHCYHFDDLEEQVNLNIQADCYYYFKVILLVSIT